MKTLATTLGLILTTLHLSASGDHWGTDLAAAKATAQKEHKLVLLDFTGSDWCPPCKKLTAEVLTQPEFLAYAAKHLVLVELDFPNKKAQSAELKAANAKLKNEFAIKGFPTLILLSADGKELWRKVGYGSGGTKPILAELDKARAK